jgi:hypothetical protein
MPHAFADGLLTKMRELSLTVPTEIDSTPQSPSELFATIVNIMANTLQDQSTREKFKEVASSIQVKEGENVEGSFDPFDEKLSIDMPLKLHFTLADFFTRVHELAHVLEHMSFGKEDLMTLFGKKESPLLLSNFQLFTEDFAYRWEFLYVKHLKKTDVESFLYATSKEESFNTDTRNFFGPIMESSQKKLSEYLRIQRNSGRHNPREAARKYKALQYAIIIWTGIGGSAACATLAYLFGLL